MRANELMIGDWVNFLIEVEGGDTEHDPQTSVYTPDQVRQIRTWGLDAEVEGDDVLNDIDQLQPIPLTDEILEKYGFHESILRDDRWIYQDIAFTKVNDSYILSSLYDDFMIGIRPHICAVHELQHALRLCNIEKEIEL